MDMSGLGRVSCVGQHRGLGPATLARLDKRDDRQYGEPPLGIVGRFVDVVVENLTFFPANY
jgi:hypothetical protein